MTTTTVLTPDGDTAACRQCGVTITDENCSEDAWIVWLQHWCQPCVEALRTTVACAGCETEMTGIPGMDWGVWTSWDGTRADHVCEPCHQQAEALQAQDMAARAPRL